MIRTIWPRLLLAAYLLAAVVACEKTESNSRNKNSNRPSEDGESLPNFLGKKTVAGKADSSLIIDFNGASILFPAGSVIVDYSATVSEYEASGIAGLIPDGVKAIGLAYQTVLQDTNGRDLTDADIAASYIVKLPIPADADLDKLAALVVHKVGGVNVAEILPGSMLDIKEVGGNRFAEFSVQYANVVCSLIEITDQEVAAEHIISSNTDGSESQSYGDGNAVDFKSAQGEVYFAKGSFASANVRLKRVDSFADAPAEVVTIGPLRGLTVTTTASANSALGAHSENPGQVTIFYETSKLDKSKAQIAYFSQYGASESKNIIPTSRLIFEDLSNGSTAVRFVVNEANFTAYLFQEDGTKGSAAGIGSYQYASTSSNVAGLSPSTSSIIIGWEDLDSTADGAIIGYNVGENEPKTCAGATNVLRVAGEDPVTISGLTTATTYTFMVCSYKGDAVSPTGPSIYYRVRSNVVIHFLKGDYEAEYAHTMSMSLATKAADSTSFSYTPIGFGYGNLLQDKQKQLYAFGANNNSVWKKPAEGATWPSINVNGSAEGTFTNVALSSKTSGSIHGVSAYNNALKHYSNHSGTFTSETISGVVQANIVDTSVAIDRDDNIHVLYAVVPNPNPKFELKLFYVKRTVLGWGTPVDLTTYYNMDECGRTNYGAMLPILDIQANDKDRGKDRLNFVHITFFCNKTVDGIEYRTIFYANNKNGWGTAETVESTTNHSAEPITYSGSMRLDSYNQPRLLWASAGVVKYRYKNPDGTWRPTEKITGSDGLYPSRYNWTLDTNNNNTLYIVGVKSYVSNAEGPFAKTTLFSNIDQQYISSNFVIEGAITRSNN